MGLERLPRRAPEDPVAHVPFSLRLFMFASSHPTFLHDGHTVKSPEGPVATRAASPRRHLREELHALARDAPPLASQGVRPTARAEKRVGKELYSVSWVLVRA